MTRLDARAGPLATAVFALLVCATFGAFLVTQRLKQSPRAVRALSITDAFAPGGDGLRDLASIRLQLNRAGDATVSIVDEDGDVVREIADRRLPAKRRIQLWWDGRNADGALVPDGPYRVRVNLRDQGRSALLANEISVDTTPPDPLVIAVPDGGRQAILPSPDGAPARFRFTGPTRLPPRVFVYRIEGKRAVEVTRFRGRRGSHVVTWNGRTGERLAPPGTYVVAVRLRDPVSNAKTSPVLRPGTAADPRGRPGVTVRYLAVQPPLAPVAAGARATAFVDSRGRPYRWFLRRVGRERIVARGRGRSPRLTFRMPEAASGVYLLSVRAGRNLAVSPVMLKGTLERKVLVVLPAISWQGRNAVDDDGDGLPNTLPRGDHVRAARPFAGSGLPVSFNASERPFLSYLDRERLRYDVTSDLALAQGRGPKLDDYRGVVLAGNAEWLPPRLSSQLRRYVVNGGKVLSLGVRTLRKDVTLSRDGRLAGATRLRDDDLFGATFAPMGARRDVELLVSPRDRIGLFKGTDGLFTGFDRIEELVSPPPRARVVAAAGEQEGQMVIVAYRLGKGLVIRTGLPEWSARLGDDPDVDELTRRSWILLSV